MPAKKHHSTKHLKRPTTQSVLQFKEPAMPKNSGAEQLAQYELKLEPIVDKKSYDHFVKAIALRVYAEFEKALRGEGVPRPELCLVGFDTAKIDTPAGVRMSDYVALNARLIVERAFVDLRAYTHAYMPRIFREMEADKNTSDDIVPYVESRVQRDLMMEIRAIAIIHIPETERYSYVSKLKQL